MTRTPIRPVGPTSQTGQSPAGQATAPDRSDRLVRPVRSVDANFGCQQIIARKKNKDHPKNTGLSWTPTPGYSYQVQLNYVFLRWMKASESLWFWLVIRALLQ